METNILKAIINIKNNNKFDLKEIYPPNSEINTENKIQNVGTGLEYFLKDSFSNSYNEINKKDIYKKYFSYTGNTNNPPDFIIKNSDAIEVKKITSFTNEIQLNSSYPHSRLKINDFMITTECRECEEWVEKDFIYAIGIFIKNSTKLKLLMLIYGDCFASNNETYEHFKEVLSENLNNIPNSVESKELGRITNIDNLNITKLRIRGMWLLKNPLLIFKKYIENNYKDNEFTLLSIMKKEKFYSMNEKDIIQLKEDEEIKINEIEINNPNDVSKKINAVMIRFDVR